MQGIFHDNGPPCLIDFPFEGLIESQGLPTLHGEPARKENCAKCGAPIEGVYRIRYRLCMKCLPLPKRD